MSHLPYKAHPVLGLLCWCDAEGQYRQARPEDGYPNADEFPEIKREADRLNAEVLSSPMTQEEEEALEEWLIRVLPLRQTKKEETLCEKKQRN